MVFVWCDGGLVCYTVFATVDQLDQRIIGSSCSPPFHCIVLIFCCVMFIANKIYLSLFTIHGGKKVIIINIINMVRYGTYTKWTRLELQAAGNNHVVTGRHHIPVNDN